MSFLYVQNTVTFKGHPQVLQNEDVGISSFQEEKSVAQSGSRGYVVPDRDGLGLGTKDPPSEHGTAPLAFTLHKRESEEGISGTPGEKDPVGKTGKETWGLTPNKLLSVEGLTSSSEKEKQSEINSGKEQRKLVEAKILSKLMPKNNNNNLGKTAKGESQQRDGSAKYPQELTLFAFEVMWLFSFLKF